MLRVLLAADDEEAIRRYEAEGYVVVGEAVDESLADELDNNVCLAAAVQVVMEKRA